MNPAFTGSASMNFTMGVVCAVISLIVAAVLTFLFGFDKDSEAFDPDEPERA